ncbi:AVRPPHE avirulence protein [Ralstonia pseudosolanacearum]|uniref:AVRPPHE avirulence protein n=1 Tax=Ralstonia pseudosolanacearum TaxID=1310165 RepID=UPI003AAEE72D
MPPVLPSILRCFRPAVSRPEAETAAPSSSQEHNRPGSPERSPRRAPAALQGLTPRAGSSRRQAVPETPPEPASFLTDGECQLGGYLMAREVDRRPVEGEPLDALRPANETLLQARRMLPYGRGNVDEDIAVTRGASSIRAEAGRQIQDFMADAHPEPVIFGVIPMVSGAGNCGEHADLATVLHAAKLKNDEQVHRTSVPGTDHCWAVLRGGTPDPKKDVVIDPWGKGPAIFAEDSEYSRDSERNKTSFYYDRASGAQAQADVEMLRTVLEPEMRRRITNSIHALGPDFRYSPEMIWAVEPSVAQDFAQRVQEAMAQPADLSKLAAPDNAAASVEPPVTNESLMRPLRQAIQATRTARTLGARNVDAIAHAAGRIVEVAQDLRGYPVALHLDQPAEDAAEAKAAEQRRTRRAALGKGASPETEPER